MKRLQIVSNHINCRNNFEHLSLQRSAQATGKHWLRVVLGGFASHDLGTGPKNPRLTRCLDTLILGRKTCSRAMPASFIERDLAGHVRHMKMERPGFLGVWQTPLVGSRDSDRCLEGGNSRGGLSIIPRGLIDNYPLDPIEFCWV